MRIITIIILLGKASSAEGALSGGCNYFCHLFSDYWSHRFVLCRYAINANMNKKGLQSLYICR